MGIDEMLVGADGIGKKQRRGSVLLQQLMHTARTLLLWSPKAMASRASSSAGAVRKSKLGGGAVVSASGGHKNVTNAIAFMKVKPLPVLALPSASSLGPPLRIFPWSLPSSPSLGPPLPLSFTGADRGGRRRRAGLLVFPPRRRHHRRPDAPLEAPEDTLAQLGRELDDRGSGR